MKSLMDRFVGNISPVALLASSFFWTWFDIVPFSPLLFSAAGVPFNLHSIMLASAISTFTLAVLGLLPKVRKQLIDARIFAICTVFCGSAGSIAVYFGALMSNMPLLISGAVLVGLFEGAGMMVMGCLISCQGTTNALIHLPLALPLNIVFLLIALFLQPIAQPIFTAFLPLCCCICFSVFAIRDANSELLLQAARPTPTKEGHSAKTGSVFKRCWKFLATVLVVTIAFGFINFKLTDAPGSASFAAYIPQLIRAVASFAVLIGYLRFSWRPQGIYATALLIMAIDTVTLGLSGSDIAGYLFLAGYLCFDLIIWALVIALCNRTGASILKLICIVFAVDQLGITLGTFLASGVLDSSACATFCIVVGCAIMLAMVLLSRDSGPTGFNWGRNTPLHDLQQDDSAIELPLETTSDAPACVATLTARYFLSSRETEILTLLITGRSGPYIAKQLCVSDNTVKTHVRHIYTKLDVHNRQELLDLVDQQNF